MGLFSTKSSSRTDQSTNVTTTTSTDVGDVGFQSDDARAVIESAATQTGNAFSQFAGGAQALAEKALDQNDSTEQILSRNLPLIIAAGGLTFALYAALKR